MASRKSVKFCLKKVSGLVPITVTPKSQNNVAVKLSSLFGKRYEQQISSRPDVKEFFRGKG
jgi:hypothetical protein